MSEIDATIGELKREAKLQKALKKKEKKEAKRAAKERKKEAKREKKARKLAAKAGMTNVEVATAEAVSLGDEDATVVGIDWDRQSRVPMERVERQLDNLFEARGDEIKKRWMEKYGDEPDIPDSYFRPKVDMDHLDRAPTSPESTGEVAVATEDGKKGRFSRKGKKAKPAKTTGESAGELGLLDFKAPTAGLWLYQKYGVGKNKVVSIIIMIISLIAWIFPMLIIRIIVLLVRKITGGVKKKRGTTAEV